MLKKTCLIMVLLLVGVLMSITEGEAQQSPEALRDKAYTSIDVAMELMQQAGSTVDSPRPTREQLRTAVALYVRAGKRFERAINILTSLGPEYYREQDVRGARQALSRCIKMINRCRQRLSSMKKYR